MHVHTWISCTDVYAHTSRSPCASGRRYRSMRPRPELMVKGAPARVYARTHTHAHAYARAHARTRARTHVRAHARTRAHTHAHARTHTHKLIETTAALNDGQEAMRAGREGKQGQGHAHPAAQAVVQKQSASLTEGQGLGGAGGLEDAPVSLAQVVDLDDDFLLPVSPFPALHTHLHACLAMARVAVAVGQSWPRGTGSVGDSVGEGAGRRGGRRTGPRSAKERIEAHRSA